MTATSRARRWTRGEARDYHLPQARAFADAGADLVSSLTLTTVNEAIGVALAAGEAGLPVSVGFTVETDGRLPDGTTLRAAVEAVDDVAPPDWFVVNCAHPSHVAAAAGGCRALAGADRRHPGQRLALSHAELDAAEELDEGDPAALGLDQAALAASLPGLHVVGGCCGTDARHVAAMWGVPAARYGDDTPGVSRGGPRRRTRVRLGSSTGGAPDSTRPQAHGSP